MQHHNENLHAKELPPAFCRQILAKLSQRWDRRASVRSDLQELNTAFEIEKSDFLLELLPFACHPRFHNSDPKLKEEVLSLGWLKYNYKTIAIETEIINPLCQLVVDNRLPGITEDIYKEISSETMIDESYHVRLCLLGCNNVIRHRGVTLPNYKTLVVKHLRTLQQQCKERWQRDLALLATSIVSEIVISDYLKIIANSTRIQPINRIITNAHRKDELAHSKIFSIMGQHIFDALDHQKQEFVAQTLAKPMAWFSDPEWEAWQQILEKVGFQKASEMINECKEEGQAFNLEKIDFSGIMTFSQNIGICQSSKFQDGFFDVVAHSA